MAMITRWCIPTVPPLLKSSLMAAITTLCSLSIVAQEPVRTEQNQPTQHQDSQARDTQSETEKRVMNCAVMLGMTLETVLREQPVMFDARPFADTLYQVLYVKPEDMSTASRYMAKTYLQAFFFLSGDARIDYPDMERCLAVTGKNAAFHTQPFLVCAYGYSQWAKEQGLTDKAIAAMQLGLKAHDKLYPDSTTVFSQAFNLNLSEIYYTQKEWRLAGRYAERMLVDMNRLGQSDSEEYFETLSLVAFTHKMSGQKVKADSCLVKIQQHMEEHGETADEKYMDVVLDRAEIQQSLGHYDQAESLLVKAQSNLKPSDELHQEVTLELAQLYTAQEQNEKVIAIVKQMLSQFEKTPPPSARMLIPWIVFCNNPLSTNEGQRFVHLLQKMQDGSVENMAVLAYAYSHAYDYEKAMQTTQRMEEAYAQLSAEEQEDLQDCLQSLYSQLGDIDRQIELDKQQVASIEKVVGNRHELYARALALLGTTYSLKGDYYRSLQMLDSCVNIPGIDNEVQIGAYKSMAEVYADMGDFRRSTHYATVLLNHTDDATTQRELMGRIVVNLICELDIRQSDIDEQGKADTDSLKQMLIDYANRSLRFCQEHFGESHINTIEATEYLAAAYYLTDNTAQMKQTLQTLEQNIRQNLKNQQLQKIYLEGLSVYYQEIGEYSKALSLVDSTSLQKKNVMLAEARSTLEALSELHLDMGHHSLAQHYFEQLAHTLMAATSNQMNTLTSQARQHYWRLSRNVLSGAGKYIQSTGQPDPFAGTIYDLALYTKDILLGSEQAFVRAVRSTGDQVLMEKMRQMMNLRTDIVQHPEMAAKEMAAKNQYAEQLERELLASCQKAHIGTPNEQQANWHQVQQALPDSAMAIEMVQYKQRDHSDHYGAVLLRKDWTAPIFVPMGRKAQFDSIKPQDLSQPTCQQVWQFAQPYLEGLNAIYFSPIGIFHRLPIEDMLPATHIAASQPLQLYRLSSTRQLLPTPTEPGHDAVVYGGLTYNLSLEEMKQNAQKNDSTRGAGAVMRLKELKGTAIEADSIVRLISESPQANMAVTPYRGKEGTEESLKALSGQRKQLLHIGTHGFYSPQSRTAASLSLMHGLLPVANAEDIALAQSGLYMAGGDNKKLGQTIPDGVDDGALTAQEIAALDFRGLNLVTLSACQSAMGDISSDGVFGLQRGFKKAGAQSILMSLWNVDDEATCLLMTEFYRHWIGEQKSKHEALEQAKRTVRSHKEKGWDSPKYWAAFILLDGHK